MDYVDWILFAFSVLLALVASSLIEGLVNHAKT